jgi:DNA helicase II / ATP-dependent DNA helicase PcrA
LEILLAGPGTGKTTKVKSIIKEQFLDAENILVLSFTNATVNDLRESFVGNHNISCYTLHSYALKINHLPTLHVLNDSIETPILNRYSQKLELPFQTLAGLLGCIRFEEMITSCIQFMRNNPAYAEEKIGTLDLFIVDEFQDFNEVERELVLQISNYANNTFILGDDDQSIYGFKNADPDGIITIYNNDDNVKIEHDNICYRCPDEVVLKSKKLIENNAHRLAKDWNVSNIAGEVVQQQLLSQDRTFDYISSTLNEIRIIDPQASILLLSPVKFYLDDLIEKLTDENLPIINFWNVNISMDTLHQIWWLKSIYSSHRLLNLLLLCNEYKSLSRNPFIRLLKESFQRDYDVNRLIVRIIELNYLPENLAQLIINPPSLEELFESFPEFINFQGHLDSENLEVSVNNLEKSLRPDVSFDPSKINIMSIHKSKGLQADYVFIYSLTDGIIPNVSDGLDSIEAYRRLLFVGMTRAKKRLYLISTVEWEGKYVNKADKTRFRFNGRKRKWYGRASRFINEINM